MRSIPALLLLAACGSDLGDLDADHAVLADTEPLAHLGAALAPGATVLDLFDRPEFTQAPDPSALFASRHAAHAALAPVEGTSLKVVTFNTGLLSRKYLFTKVEVPALEARREVMGAHLFQGDHDVLFLQEVWEWEDTELLAEAAMEAGYRMFSGTKKRHREHGLSIAVRADLIGGVEETDEQQYDAQWKLEHFPGPNLKRGWLRWSFDLDGRRIHLFNTHLTPFTHAWETRNLQVRELGLEIDALSGEDVVLLGGDLNAGWYQPDDVWVDGDGDEHAGLWANGAAVPLLLHYGGLDDVPNAHAPLRDVELADTVPTGQGAAMLDTPYGDASWCEETPHVAFTASDCNTLHFQGYAGQERPARLDHLLWRGEHVRVIDAGLVFTEPVVGGVELSDHYGVAAELIVGR